MIACIVRPVDGGCGVEGTGGSECDDPVPFGCIDIPVLITRGESVSVAGFTSQEDCRIFRAVRLEKVTLSRGNVIRKKRKHLLAYGHGAVMDGGDESRGGVDYDGLNPQVRAEAKELARNEIIDIRQHELGFVLPEGRKVVAGSDTDYVTV